MTTKFSMQSFNNMIIVKYNNQKVLGFHPEKLEVAQLSDVTWQDLTTNQQNSEALQELLDWSKEKAEAPPSRPSAGKHTVRSITINVTQVCNLHCTYCAAGGDGTFGDPVKKISIEKTLPQIKFFIDKLPEQSEFKITFLGGEPLLYAEAIDLIAEYASELALQKNVRVKYVVVTNGTLFNEKTVQTLKNIKANITLSIDGAPEINDKLRPNKAGKGVTKQIIEGLDLLFAAKDQLETVGFSGVFGANNLDLVSAYNFFSKFPIDWMDFTYDHLETSPVVNEKFTDSLSQVAELAFQAGGEKSLRKIKLFDTYFQILDSQIKNENYCGAGKSFLIIDAKNQMYTCPWVVGDKKELVGVGTDLWQDKLVPYSDTLIEKNGCHSCWVRNICGGGCMYIHKNSTGSKHSVDNNYCTRTRQLIANTLLYYEKSRQLENDVL